MAADTFTLGLRERTPTAKQIDAGAEALRQLEQGGRLLRKWEDLPNSSKNKWCAKSRAVLEAALAS